MYTRSVIPMLILYLHAVYDAGPTFDLILAASTFWFCTAMVLLEIAEDLLLISYVVIFRVKLRIRPGFPVNTRR